MTTNTQLEVETNAIEFAQNYISLLIEIDRMKEDLMEMISEYKSMGVPTKNIIEALNKGLKEYTKTQRTRESEITLIEEWLKSSKMSDCLGRL